MLSEIAWLLLSFVKWKGCWKNEKPIQFKIYFNILIWRR
jgi:hypothetical protein